MTHAAKVIISSLSGGVLEIALSNPEGRNATNLGWVELLEATLNQVDGEVRVVLLHAEGKYFSVGGDVSNMPTSDQGTTIRYFADRLNGALLRLHRLEVPVITVVNGWAAGAGMSIALTGDIIIAGPLARMRAAYGGLGFTPDGGLTWQLAKRLPPAVALDLLISDREIGAPEALQLGLVSRLVHDQEPLEAARHVAAHIASRSRGANGSVKKLVWNALLPSLGPHLLDEAEAMAAAAASPDGVEGVRAFLEKRSPKFNQF